jgi:hypothetical protein
VAEDFFLFLDIDESTTHHTTLLPEPTFLILGNHSAAHTGRDLGHGNLLEIACLKLRGFPRETYLVQTFIVVQTTEK